MSISWIIAIVEFVIIVLLIARGAAFDPIADRDDDQDTQETEN